jgi:hypothetical protein
LPTTSTLIVFRSAKEPKLCHEKNFLVNQQLLSFGPVIGAGCAVLWTLLCVRWFDAGAAYRPRWLAAVPVPALAAATLALLVVWCVRRGPALRAPVPPFERRAALAVAAIAFLFRLPLAWHGAAAYTTADGALSGIVALHVRDGGAHDVFVPQVPYSGSLKSHLTALPARVIDPARAFALVSALFYAAFVAAVYRLAVLALGPAPALAAGLYAAFSPAFVTHYSLSNDGNYVEVLAFGSWALVLAARWLREAERRSLLALAMGLVLGLGFWCHVIVIVHAAAIGLMLLVVAPRDALRSLPALVFGFALGDMPALIWNAGNGWDSFRALLPGASPAAVGAQDPALAERAWRMLTEHAPLLLGYDPGNPAWADVLLMLLSGVAVLVAGVALVRAARDGVGRANPVLTLLALFALVDIVVTLVALRYVPGNPRYLLFLMAPLPILLARELAAGRGRVLFALLVAMGAVGSVAQGLDELALDQRWRGFVGALETAGVRRCQTDFYLSTRINFLSEERVICASKLGPTRTEYFFEYRTLVDAAPQVALVAASAAQGDKIARRLDGLGVGYRRTNLMRPVFVDLSRKVDPEELFPGQSFGMR